MEIGNGNSLANFALATFYAVIVGYESGGGAKFKGELNFAPTSNLSE